MTWKEFKEKVEAEGVQDDDELWYIDVSDTDFDVKSKDVMVKSKDVMGWAIA